MKPFYEKEGMLIYCGDCLEVMPHLEKTVDVVVYSPPYNKGGMRSRRRTRKAKTTPTWERMAIVYPTSNDDMPEDEYQEWQVEILKSIKFNLLRRNGSVFYNHKNRIKDNLIISPFEWLFKAPFVVRQQIVWNRKGSPQVAPIRFLPSTEFIFWLTPRPLGVKDIGFNKRYLGYMEVWEIRSKPDPGHPAPFPVGIPLRCIGALKNVEVVCDPMMGIGHTLVAAKLSGRKAIGIEIEEEYCEIAAEKLDRIKSKSMFAYYFLGRR